MSIFEKKFYPRPILIVLEKENKNISYLFAGQVDDSTKTILESILEKGGDLSKISKKELHILEELYGRNLPILKKKIKYADHLIFETIYMSDNILSVKKKIFLELSTKNNIISPDNQYLYIKHKIDNKLFLEIIENIYLDMTTLGKKEIKHELTKILDKKINLTKNLIIS